MGEKGATQSNRAAETARGLVEDLAPLGEVTSKKMFGGFGIFEDGLMFALVDSGGSAFLRLGASNEDRYQDRHGKMPYGLVPAEVLADDQRLLTWANEALQAARAAKKK
jgi:DNA transformation protein